MLASFLALFVRFTISRRSNWKQVFRWAKLRFKIYRLKVFSSRRSCVVKQCDNEPSVRAMKSRFVCVTAMARFMICEFIATVKCWRLMVAERGSHRRHIEKVWREKNRLKKCLLFTCIYIITFLIKYLFVFPLLSFNVILINIFMYSFYLMLL